MKYSSSALAGRYAPALKRLIPPKHRSKALEVIFPLLPASAKSWGFVRAARAAVPFARSNGSPLYAHLFEVLARDVEARGPCWRAVEVNINDAKRPPAAISFMAAVHRVVLEHRGSALEDFYPSVGGTVDLERVGPAFLDVVDLHRDSVAVHLQRLVQTNEVARSRVLLGGFLTAAQTMGDLPLRLLEFGASAGLNLRWDHYRYEIGDQQWGDENSPLRLVGGFVEGTPPLALTAQVVERRGCDLAPIDPTSTDGQMQLLSHVWADQAERIAHLRAAFEVAAHVDAPVERADAASWVASVLQSPTPGRATVIYDTCMMGFLDPPIREEIGRTIEVAGQRATSEHPLAWLHLKPATVPQGDEELYLTTWPGGTRRLLATCDPYARQARWHG